MGRAFTEEEREKIRTRILEEALNLFHEAGRKSLNISELTRRAGIAQGGFYSFWKDKESLISDLITYRATQKLRRMEVRFPESLRDPAAFLASVLFQSSVDMAEKIRKQPLYSDAFRIFLEGDRKKMKEMGKIYYEFLYKLHHYWEKEESGFRMDLTGMENAVIGLFLLVGKAELFDEEYFEELLRMYTDAAVRQYVKVG